MTIHTEIHSDQGTPIAITADSSTDYEADSTTPLSDEEQERAQAAVWESLEARREDAQELRNQFA